MIFLLEKLEVSSKALDKSEIIPIRVIWANLINFYYIKLCKTIKTNSIIENIYSYYLLSLAIDINNCICQFNYL